MSELRPEAPHVSAATVRLVYLAAVGLAVSGVLHVVQGAAALRGDDLLTLRPSYLGDDRGDTWGWVHLIVGALLIATAVGVLRGSGRALAYAAGIAVVATIASFVSIPFYPAWGAVGLVLNTTALYAIGTVGTTGHWARPAQSDQPRPGSPAT